MDLKWIRKKACILFTLFFYNIESRLFFINSFLLAIGIGDFKTKIKNFRLRTYPWYLFAADGLFEVVIATNMLGVEVI